MNTQVKRSIGLSLVLSGTLFLTACGSGGSDSASSDAAAETAAADVTDTTFDVQEQLDAAKDADDALGGGNCAEAATAFGTIATSAAYALSNPDGFAVDELKKNIEIVRAAIPAELEDEFELFAEMYIAYGETIAEIGGMAGLSDPSNASKLDELSNKLDDEDVTAAGETIADYFSDECDFLGGE
jgi:hypothetical protein